MLKRKQPPEPPSDSTAVRRWRRPHQNGEVYVESIGANVRPVPGSNTQDGSERISRIARDALDRVRRSIQLRTSATD